MRGHCKLIIYCETCNKQFKRHYYLIKKNKHNYCSHQCSYKDRKNQKNSYYNHNTYNITKKFLYREYITNKKSTRQIAKELECSYGTIRHWACKYNICFRKRNETKHEIFKGKGNPGYINGNGNFPYPLIFDKFLKEQIRKRDIFACQKCGITEEKHLTLYGRVLDVHHIDYNKQNCEENNLITLCHECNINVNHDRNYWMVYFQQKVKILTKTYGEDN